MTGPHRPKGETSEPILPAPAEIAKIAAALSSRSGSSELMRRFRRALTWPVKRRLYPAGAKITAATREEFFEGDLDSARQAGLQEFLEFMKGSEVRGNDHQEKLLYWELEEPFLDRLITWRREVILRSGRVVSSTSRESTR
jgi:hypothetical protein